MIRVALQTLKARWVSFAGTVVALVLGVTQVAAMGLLLGALLDLPDRPAQRFAGAPAVVYATDPSWDPARHDLGVVSLPQARGIPADLVARIAATGPVVVDRSFYARVTGTGKADQVGHPWSTAGFGGYRLVAGRAAAADDEVVLGGDVAAARPGDSVTVLTAGEARVYRVAGVTAPVGYERAVFFTDAEAARLSPRVEALVALGPLDAVRAATGAGAEVLTGDRRHLADVSAAQDREALDNTATLLPITAGVAGSTAVFVVASTFAFAVAQRRREIALLRAVGATPIQVRRMVLAEALTVGAGASVAGAFLGLFGAHLLARWFVRLGLSPGWFDVHPAPRLWVLVPMTVAALTGLTVAVAGASAAGRRAGRIRPLEALRDASADQPAPRGRRLLGLAGVAAAAGTVLYVAVAAPQTTLMPNKYVPTLLVPVFAAALLAPLLVGPLARALTVPLRRLHGAGVTLIRQSALAAPRRTAATAVPVLITVGLAGSLFGATASINAARDSGLRNAVRADLVLVPAGGPGIGRAAVDRAVAVPGVSVLAPVFTTLYTDDDGRVQANDANVVEPAALAGALRLTIVQGSLAGFTDETVVVAESWGYEAGAPIDFLLPDGTAATLRVAAVYTAPRGQDAAYVTRRFAAAGAYARDGVARRVYVSLDPGTDPAAALTALRAAVTGLDVRVETAAEVTATDSAESRRITALRQRSVGLIVILFCCVAILNTLVMSTADRHRELAALRMAGATRRQVLRYLAAEALLVSAIGIVLAAVATAVNLAGLWVALTRLFGPTPILVPAATVTAVAVLATVLAVAGTVLPAISPGAPTPRRL